MEVCFNTAATNETVWIMRDKRGISRWKDGLSRSIKATRNWEESPPTIWPLQHCPLCALSRRTVRQADTLVSISRDGVEPPPGKTTGRRSFPILCSSTAGQKVSCCLDEFGIFSPTVLLNEKPLSRATSFKQKCYTSITLGSPRKSCWATRDNLHI